MLLSQTDIDILYRAVNNRFASEPNRLDDWLNVFDEESEKRGYEYNFSLGCTCDRSAYYGHFPHCCLTVGVK